MRYAAAGGHESIVRLLLDRGATDNDEALGEAALYHKSIARLMLDHGAIDYNYIYKDNAITAAAREGHVSIVRLLLDQWYRR